MFPLIAALSQVGGILIDKITLTRRQVEVRIYLPILFLFLVVFTGILFPWLGKINGEFRPLYIGFFVLMILCAVGWNLLYYRGVKAEKVQDYELIIMFQPLLTIVLAALVYPSERNIHIIIAALIAAVALIFSHFKKRHLDISLGTWQLVGAVVLMSVELLIIKELLHVFSPVALYFFRTGIMFLIYLSYFRPKVNRIANTNYMLMATSAILGTSQMVSKFYGFEIYGIVYTSLILIISPVLVYIFSNIFLHEKFRARTIISFIVILGCIVYASILGK